MRRHVLSRLDDLDLDARELAAAAARRAGLSLEEWAAVVLAGSEDEPVPPRTGRRTTGSDLDNLIARMAAPARSKRNYETLMAAIAAENERQAQDQSARTTIALESMASWIEQAEVRLNDAARTSADQQDRIAATLTQVLTSLKDRLDSVERQVATERAAPPRIEFPMEEALKALAPVSETLTGLRADMARLATHLAQPDPAVETIRADIDGLRSGIDNLATRDEIAALDAALGTIVRDLEQGPTAKDLRTLASSITVLYEQIQTLSDEVSDGLHRRIGQEIDLVKNRIDALNAKGVDRSVIEFLSSQIVDMRQDLASRAEPQQIGRLADGIESLGRQMTELRLHQVGKSDFAALKSSLDDVCSALYVTATSQETSKVSEQLESLSRRLDLLARRPDPAPANLAPIAEQLALLTERMAALSGSRSDGDDGLADMEERLSSRIEAVAGREAPSHEPLMQRFDRIEQELQQVGQRSGSAELAQMLRAIDEKLDRARQPAGTEALERQIAALAERLETLPGDALHKAVDEVSGHLKTLRSDAAGIAERAARTALDEIRPALPDAGDLDTLKHGFVELKALHSRSDKKTQETLRAVQEALESLASRLPDQVTPPAATAVEARPDRAPDPLLPADRLEAAVRRLHAATLSRAQEAVSPASEAALEAFANASRPHWADGETGSAFPAVSETERSHLRASFIAAARRAAQIVAMEPEPPPAAPPLKQEASHAVEGGTVDESGSPSATSSLFERLRRTLDSHRRPLLFSLAFLILAAGTTQILPGKPGAAALASAPERPEAAQPAGPLPAIAASREPAAGEASLFQTSSLAEGAAPALPIGAGQFLVDPATVSGIPLEAPATLRQAALSGDAAALYDIAARLAEGRGMAQDLAAAARLFERAAQAGLPPAQERLAILHEQGRGVARDLKQATFWYERAALGGNVRAMHNLATLLASGQAGKPDYAAALRWYGEAAEAGFRDSQFNSGLLLLRGIGAKADLPKAYRWFSLAAAQGDGEAAQKRDEIARRLGAADLKAAKAALDLWRPRPVDPVANRPPVAPDGQTAALDRTSGTRS